LRFCLWQSPEHLYGNLQMSALRSQEIGQAFFFEVLVYVAGFVRISMAPEFSLLERKTSHQGHKDHEVTGGAHQRPGNPNRTPL
jgi:hypothetical protein